MKTWRRKYFESCQHSAILELLNDRNKEGIDIKSDAKNVLLKQSDP